MIRFIQSLSKHPAMIALGAFLTVFGLALSVHAYMQDRAEARSTTSQVDHVQGELESIRKALEASHRDWQVMDAAFYGIRVGGAVEAAYALPFERVSRSAKGSHKTVKWVTPDGNFLTTTFDSDDDRVLQIAVDWGGDEASADAGISDFIFGRTTLSDIRTRFESNGFAYAMKLMHEEDEGIITYNAFELRETPSIIVVFKTLVSRTDLDHIESLPPEQQILGAIGDYFRLIGISVADESYLDSVWGRNKIYDPNSNPIELRLWASDD